MTQNLTSIKKELKNCVQIETVYELIPNQTVKYITLKCDEEYFYIGTYVRMGDNKIFINNKGSIKPIKLVHKNKDGSILYRTRIFIEKTNKCTLADEESEKVIKNQQMIIEKMNEQMKKQDTLIKLLHQKLLTLEN
jgi:hypothetical protein